jgi:serine-type D-Ala-D-Ala carboxypeptidase/endopeptidase (penicillin-binding protein 4)
MARKSFNHLHLNQVLNFSLAACHARRSGTGLSATSSLVTKRAKFILSGVSGGFPLLSLAEPVHSSSDSLAIKPKRFFTFFFLIVFAAACSPKTLVLKTLRETEIKFQDHTGFALYDPIEKKTLIDFNSAHYFTPASNTKIFTLYTSLQLLGDSIASLKYIQRNDSLIFWGMGDASFLYSNVFQNDKVLQFLKSRPEKLFLSTSNFQTKHLGEGWAWDDYSYSYSSERSPFPIYGNLINIKKKTDQSLQASPSYFSKQLSNSIEQREGEEVVRGIDSNQLTYYLGKKKKDRWEIPFHYNPELIVTLLSDTLKRPIAISNFNFAANAKAVRSVPADSLYRVLMQDSDNFIAEQLLLQCAAVVSDTLKLEIAIRHSIKNFLADLPDKPQWVDGSGLSRYNLFTPRSIVVLWDKIYKQVPRERLFKLLAASGKNGTIKNWYKAEVPYIYGKTGSLSNNHCLSGYLITKKGNTLIFSVMSNNFVAPVSELKKQMEKIFKIVYEKY